MPNRSRKKQPVKDFNQLARSIVDQATDHPAPKKAKGKQDAADIDRAAAEGMGQPQNLDEPKPAKKKDPAAVALGRKGGLKGGKARAAKLTKEQRVASAKKAAAKRWGHDSSGGESG